MEFLGEDRRRVEERTASGPSRCEKTQVVPERGDRLTRTHRRHIWIYPQKVLLITIGRIQHSRLAAPNKGLSAPPSSHAPPPHLSAPPPVTAQTTPFCSTSNGQAQGSADRLRRHLGLGTSFRRSERGLVDGFGESEGPMGDFWNMLIQQNLQLCVFMCLPLSCRNQTKFMCQVECAQNRFFSLWPFFFGHKMLVLFDLLGFLLARPLPLLLFHLLRPSTGLHPGLIT